MDQYRTHREKFQMQIDAALLHAAEEVARSLLATDADIAPILLGASDNDAKLFVSRTKDRIVPVHAFVLDGDAFYVGFAPQSAE